MPVEQFLLNCHRRHDPTWSPETVDPFEREDIRQVHRSINSYQPTPLVSLSNLATELGLKNLLVKDESFRFGLKAFKALGATYAVYRWFKARAEQLRQSKPIADKFYRRQGGFMSGENQTFCTATDGNHGLGVAWTASLLGQRSAIFVPSGTARPRIEAIKSHGAEVTTVDGNYDEAVRVAKATADKNGWPVISDTSWPGYENVPRDIMAGYRTLFDEIAESVDQSTIDAVFVPAGVGALASAAAWHYSRSDADTGIKLVTVQSAAAPCLLESLAGVSGDVQTVETGDTIMAGLNCGTPSRVAWPFIRDRFDAFMSLTDDSARQAVRTYFFPKGNDPRTISGESGAAALAAVMVVMTQPQFDGLRTGLDLGRDSTVLVLNTEGDTDPESYQRILAGG